MYDSNILKELEIKANKRQTSYITSIDPNCAPEAAHHYAFQQPSHACDDPARKDSNVTQNSFTIKLSPFPVKLQGLQTNLASIAQQITKCLRG